MLNDVWARKGGPYLDKDHGGTLLGHWRIQSTQRDTFWPRGAIQEAGDTFGPLARSNLAAKGRRGAHMAHSARDPCTRFWLTMLLRFLRQHGRLDIWGGFVLSLSWRWVKLPFDKADAAAART